MLYKKRTDRKILLSTILTIILAISLFATSTSAQEKFPTKPIKMIITHGVGGSVDIPSRGISPYMQKYLGVPVVCENMEGAAGRRAMEYVFNQAKPGDAPAVDRDGSSVSAWTLQPYDAALKEGILRQIRNAQQKQSPSQEENHFGGCCTEPL